MSLTHLYFYTVMKKLLVCLTVLLSTSSVFAQIMPTANSPEYRNILKMSASQFVNNTFLMSYERFVNSGTSIYLSAGLNFKDTDYDRSWGVLNEVQMRFHVYTLIRPANSHRLYFAPYLQNHYMNAEKKFYTYPGDYWKIDTYDTFGGGMLFGWSYSFANRINLDIYTGGGLKKAFGADRDENSYINEWSDSYSGIVPRFGIDVGFWF